MTGCIFCAIASGKISAEKVFENDEFLAFKDNSPKAPIHILIIPKQHIASIDSLENYDSNFTGKLFKLVSKVARIVGVSDSGYRVVINSGENAGQSVNHLHVHLLGGRILAWPPG